MSETKVIDIKELKFDEHNFNRHNDDGMSLLEKSIKENGLGRSILLDKDNNIVGGNGVTEKAIELGKTKVRIIETDGSELIAVKRTDLTLDSEQGRKMALADNSVAHANLEWNEEELQKAQDEWGLVPEEWVVEMPDFGLPDELAGDGKTTEYTDVKDDDFDPDKDMPQGDGNIKQGDIFRLGEHRLMCGDSLNEADVLKLLNGEHAPLTFTDPPYKIGEAGGGIVGASNSMSQIKTNKVDEFDPSKLKLYSETNIYSHNKPLIKDYILLAEREGKPYDLAIYKKQGLPNYAGHLMTDLEYIAVIGDQGPKKGLDFETYSKLYVGKKDADNELSYSKPVALCGKFIMLYSDKGDIVLDIFGGSGSTMIACEQLGRKCRMMELDPHYCTVIIARWEKLTGQKAVKLNL